MPTLYGRYEEPEAVARHRSLWIALVLARLSPRDFPRYGQRLTRLYVRFLDPRAVPGAVEFSEEIGALMAMLRDTAAERAGPGFDDRPYVQAARHLRFAEWAGRSTLQGGDYDEP